VYRDSALPVRLGYTSVVARPTRTVAALPALQVSAGVSPTEGGRAQESGRDE